MKATRVAFEQATNMCKQLQVAPVGPLWLMSFLNNLSSNYYTLNPIERVQFDICVS